MMAHINLSWVDTVSLVVTATLAENAAGAAEDHAATDISGKKTALVENKARILMLNDELVHAEVYTLPFDERFICVPDFELSTSDNLKSQ